MPRTNTIDDVDQELTCLIKDDPVFKPVLWIGLFGSVSRSTHHDTSDIDLLVAYVERTSAKDEPWTCGDIFCTIDMITRKVEKQFDRRVQLSHLTEHKVTTYLELEAVLTSVTVYGADEWAKNLRELSRQYLDDGYIRLKMAYQSLKDMDSLVSKTHENVLTDSLTFERMANCRFSSQLQTNEF
jgi:predicted nucleotidyltransferase